MMRADPAFVDQMIDHVITLEGGYVDNPADAGGPTKYGITLVTLHEWRNAPVSAADVQQLTVDEARSIYRERYFAKPRLDVVPNRESLEFLFDEAINSGPGTAVRALQTALDLPADGVIGPITEQTVQRVTNWTALYWRLKAERLEMVLRYIGRKPSQSIFAEGWANRFDQYDFHDKL